MAKHSSSEQRGAKPDAAAAPERRQQEQRPGLQHQSPAHGDAQGGAVAAPPPSGKPPMRMFEAHQQIR